MLSLRRGMSLCSHSGGGVVYALKVCVLIEEGEGGVCVLVKKGVCVLIEKGFMFSLRRWEGFVFSLKSGRRLCSH